MGQHGSGNGGSGHRRATVHHGRTTRIRARSHGAGYAVQHYKQHGNGSAIPAGAWVYVRPISGGGGYKIHLDSAGHAGQLQALSGSEHPTELQVAAGTHYAAVWSQADFRCSK